MERHSTRTFYTTTVVEGGPVQGRPGGILQHVDLRLDLEQLLVELRLDLVQLLPVVQVRALFATP